MKRTEEIVTAGYMVKSPPLDHITSYWKRWKDRYFTLVRVKTEGEVTDLKVLLRYYDNHESYLALASPIDQIDLSNCTRASVYDRPIGDYHYVIKLESEKRTYFFCLSTMKELLDWTYCLNAEIEGLPVHSENKKREKKVKPCSVRKWSLPGIRKSYHEGMFVVSEASEQGNIDSRKLTMPIGLSYNEGNVLVRGSILENIDTHTNIERKYRESMINAQQAERNEPFKQLRTPHSYTEEKKGRLESFSKEFPWKETTETELSRNDKDRSQDSATSSTEIGQDKQQVMDSQSSEYIDMNPEFTKAIESIKKDQFVSSKDKGREWVMTETQKTTETAKLADSFSACSVDSESDDYLHISHGSIHTSHPPSRLDSFSDSVKDEYVGIDSNLTEGTSSSTPWSSKIKVNNDDDTESEADSDYPNMTLGSGHYVFPPVRLISEESDYVEPNNETSDDENYEISSIPVSSSSKNLGKENRYDNTTELKSPSLPAATTTNRNSREEDYLDVESWISSLINEKEPSNNNFYSDEKISKGYSQHAFNMPDFPDQNSKKQPKEPETLL